MLCAITLFSYLCLSQKSVRLYYCGIIHNIYLSDGYGTVDNELS